MEGGDGIKRGIENMVDYLISINNKQITDRGKGSYNRGTPVAKNRQVTYECMDLLSVYSVRATEYS